MPLGCGSEEPTIRTVSGSVEWRAVARDGRALTVAYGLPSGAGLEARLLRVDARETSRTVTVTVQMELRITGAGPEFGLKAEEEHVVRLAKPVGRRRLVHPTVSPALARYTRLPPRP